MLQKKELTFVLFLGISIKKGVKALFSRNKKLASELIEDIDAIARYTVDEESLNTIMGLFCRKWEEEKVISDKHTKEALKNHSLFHFIFISFHLLISSVFSCSCFFILVLLFTSCELSASPVSQDSYISLRLTAPSSFQQRRFYFGTLEVRFIFLLTFWKLNLAFNLKYLSYFFINFNNQWQLWNPHDGKSVPDLWIWWRIDWDNWHWKRWSQY